jgi:hypothetical protein
VPLAVAVTDRVLVNVEVGDGVSVPEAETLDVPDTEPLAVGVVLDVMV